MQMKSFREAIEGFAEPSAIAGRERVEGATAERGEYELDEEADDLEDPSRPNTFLARAVAEATAEEEGDRGNVGQPYSPRYEMDPEAEVDLLGDIELEHVERTIGKKGATLVEDPLDIADAETLDPNAEDDTSSPLDSPRLPNSASHDSMTTGGSSSDDGGGGGGNSGGGGGGGDSGQGGGDGDSGQGGGGGRMAFTEEQIFRGATQDTSHGARLKYNRRQKFSRGGHAGGSPVDSNRYDTMISDFERMSTQESVGSYGGHNYHPESTSTDYSSGYTPYSGYTATSGYLGPSPYMYPLPAFSVHVPVQVFAPVEDVQRAQLNVVRPGCQMWDHYLSQFRQRYHTMMTWDEYRNFVSQTKGYHIIGELPSESDESELVPSQSQWNAYDPYQQGHWGY
ncbi:hypothetical protein Taro_030541 [Colocasia esculenta]|uniref:Uncharacterized protein n=1 Tax=Colocasia esculenta TaxID=4460 RepID=A0A843VUB0_COLES|nr:hypothetical protein [Colocasia esculenta]